jgi:disulfide oxidoreductase YuzD
MSASAQVQIIGAPLACASGVQDSWRGIAAWVGQQLAGRFGEAVRVEYYDLFDPQAPLLPPEAQLPLVLVNGQVLSSGGKISLPALRKHLEALGLTPCRLPGGGSWPA